MTTEPFREFVLAHNAGLHRTAVLLTRDPHAAPTCCRRPCSGRGAAGTE